MAASEFFAASHSAGASPAPEVAAPHADKNTLEGRISESLTNAKLRDRFGGKDNNLSGTSLNQLYYDLYATIADSLFLSMQRILSRNWTRERHAAA
eukprot:1367248-Pyramimonas_sp.AAC.2